MQPHTPVFTDAGQVVAVAAGDDFFIALPSNPTTGYTWTQSLGDGKILAYEGNVYQPPSAGLMGAGGEQIFIYHANRSGSTRDFVCVRAAVRAERPAGEIADL